MSKIKYTIFLFIIMLLGITGVFADGETEEYITYATENKYTISVDATYNAGSDLNMKLGGSGYVNEEGTQYYVYMTDDETIKVDDLLNTNSIGCLEPDIDSKSFPGFKGVLGSGKIFVSHEWYMMKNYTKAFVVKRTFVDQKYYCEITQNPISLTKPAVPELGKRYQYYLFGDSGNDLDFENTLSIFPYYPYNSVGLIVKIGRISDSEIIKKFAKNSDDARESLLEYAKKDDEHEFSLALTVTGGEQHTMDVDVDVVNGAYYYIYTTVVDNDNKYRDLSDITIVMGENKMLVTDVKYDSIEDEIIVDNQKEADKTVENKDTGVYYGFGLMSMLLVVGILSYGLIRRKSRFPKHS